jgi:hypothetical protein
MLNYHKTRSCYNATMCRVRVIIVGVQTPKQKLNFMSLCMYPCIPRLAKRIFSPTHYFIICGLSGCALFLPHYLIKGAILSGKTLFNIKHVF